MPLQTRTLGSTGVEVTILGLGGEGILRTYDYEDDADELINAALDLGVRYFESARAYAGSEGYYGNALGERRSQVFLTSKSHGRDRRTAMAHLKTTLRNMRTDHLDLWQLHDMRNREEIEEVFSPDGAIEAFIEAKERGLTRFVGVTGHHDPSILKECLERFDFDTVLIPVNPAEPRRDSFLQEVLPVAVSRNMGIIGMKVYARGLVTRLPRFQSMEPFFRFALSQPVSTVVIGCDNLSQLEENLSFAERFSPMTREESDRLVEEVGLHADELMYYKERRVVGEPE